MHHRAHGSASVSTLRLLLWPVLLTLAVSVLRLVLEMRGVIDTVSGGGLALIGISWLPLPFGAWFGWRLARAGSRPLLGPAWLWYLLAVVPSALVRSRRRPPTASPPHRSEPSTAKRCEVAASAALRRSG